MELLEVIYFNNFMVKNQNYNLLILIIMNPLLFLLKNQMTKKQISIFQ